MPEYLDDRDFGFNGGDEREEFKYGLPRILQDDNYSNPSASFTPRTRSNAFNQKLLSKPLALKPANYKHPRLKHLQKPSRSAPEIPRIQLGDEHSIEISDTRAGTTYNLFSKDGQTIEKHPNRVTVWLYDRQNNGTRLGIYEHQQISIEQIISDIPQVASFQINRTNTDQQTVEIEDKAALKQQLADRLSLIPELEKQYINDSTAKEKDSKQDITTARTAHDSQVSSESVSSSSPLKPSSVQTEINHDRLAVNVSELTASEKISEAFKRAMALLPEAVGQQLKAIFTPTAIASMVAVFGAYAASHAVGIGFIADAVMGLGAGLFLGWQAIGVVKDLFGFFDAINATTEEDLDKAGQHLANAISTVGVDIVIGLLTKKAAGKLTSGTNNIDDVASSADNVDDLNTGRIDNVDRISPNRKKIDEPETSSNQVDEITPKRDRSIKMSSAAKTGVESSDYSIKVGTVRMKEHPNYQNLISEVEGKGYKIVEDGEARVSYVEIINSQMEIIAVEKELHVLPNMRYIDLEHEVGHIKQLERFEGNLYTDRYKQNNNGKRKLFNQNAPHVLQEWQDHITEYHNRLDEFLRLHKRDTNPELLLEHAEGISIWYEKQGKGTKWGKKKDRIKWIEQHFPDLRQLSIDYNQAIQQLRKNSPDLFENIRLV